MLKHYRCRNMDDEAGDTVRFRKLYRLADISVEALQRVLYKHSLHAKSIH